MVPKSMVFLYIILGQNEAILDEGVAQSYVNALEPVTLCSL